MNKNVLIIGLVATLVISLGLIYSLERKSLGNLRLATEHEAELANAKRTASLAHRLTNLESELSHVSDQVAKLHDLFQVNFISDGESDEDEQGTISEGRTNSVEPELDPFSPEGIAKADEQQNSYVSQVEKIYHSEEISTEWADSMEAEIFTRLSDLNSFSEGFIPSSRSTIGSPYVAPDISVDEFSCRSQLCAAQIVSGTMEEMLAYQNYMVKQTKAELPSIVFSTIEPDGSKFRMRAYLAKQDFEFPPPISP